MDDDYPDCKPDKVKLELELMLDDVIDADAPFTASHLEGSHHVSDGTSADQYSAFPEKIELNLAYGLPSVPERTSSASGFETVMIKEEPTEEETPSPVFHSEGCASVPSETSVEQSSNFPEKIEPNLVHDLPLPDSSANRFVAVFIKEERTEDAPASPECSMDNLHHYSMQRYIDPAQSIASTCSPSMSHINSGAIKFSDESCTVNRVEPILDKKTPSLEQNPETSISSSNGMSLNATSSMEKSFPSEQASAQLKCKSDLQSHSPIHSSKKSFCCEQCSAQFTRKTSLNRHMLTHSNARAFACDQCPARFNQKDILRKHLRTHSNIKPFSCNQCFAQFPQKSYLKSHISRHSKKQTFSCEVCSAPFAYKYNLKKHMLSHSNERSFSCELCSARFLSKSTLQFHMLTHSDEKMYSCDICNYRFKRKFILKTHMLLHFSQKQYSCKRCSAQFNRKSNLARHSLIHSIEKVFSCDVCSAQFTSKESLKDHFLIHKSKKAFCCNQCAFKCKKKSELQSHLITHSDLNTISPDL